MTIKKPIVLNMKAQDLKKGDEIEIDGRKGTIVSIDASTIQVPAHRLNQTVLSVSFEGTRIETFITPTTKRYPKSSYMSGRDRVRQGVSGWFSKVFNKIF